MAAQGQTIASTQPQHRRMIGILVVAFAGAALAITVAWAALGATSPKVVTPSRTTDQILTEPGLMDQRAGEHGVAAPAPAPAPAKGTGYPGGWTSNYSPIGVVAAPAKGTGYPGGWTSHYSPLGSGSAPATGTGYPGGWTSTYSPLGGASNVINVNDEGLKEMRRGERGR